MASRLRVAALALLLAASLAGCISMPSGGQVQSYTITQGPVGQSQPYPQIFPQAPNDKWTPDQVVYGFLTASASGANGQKIAQEYLAPGAQWKHTWNATVYKNDEGPTIAKTTAVPVKGRGKPASMVVTIGGKVQASVSESGGYIVPSASASAPQLAPFTFTLVKVGAVWRIKQAPNQLLLTSDEFDNDYQQRNLYFFDDSTSQYLVPDPVYVPLQDTPASLMGNLVSDLIKPPADWLSGGTRTAFPVGTTPIGGVTIAGGTATVNLAGQLISAAAAAAKDSSATTMLEQISAQLGWTLTGSGQGGAVVQSFEVLVNGKPWSPPGSQENPVQRLPAQPTQYAPAPLGSPSAVFYYLDNHGNVVHQDGPQGKPSAPIARLGAGFAGSQIAVSPNPKYPFLAVLRSDGTLFTETIGGKLVQRQGIGSPYTSMSWDPNGHLWATSADQVVMLRGNPGPSQLEAAPVAVNVVNQNGSPNLGSYAALRVAPDGVRVALVGGSVLSFGAIAYQPATRVSQLAIKIVLSPFYVVAPGPTAFTGVTWYGTDNVIALGDQATPVLTEYPVSGGSSTSVTAPPNTESVTAVPGDSLIASLANGAVMADTTLTGPWAPIEYGADNTPLKGYSPVYPG